MAQKRVKLQSAGVSGDKELIGVPTGDDVSAEDRVKALFTESMSEEMYQVSFTAVFGPFIFARVSSYAGVTLYLLINTRWSSSIP